MIVKILDDNLQDKHLIEAAHVRWNEGGKVLDCFAKLTDHEPIKIRVAHGDRVFFMNEQGKTVDSKRVELKPEATHDELQN